MHIYFSGIGGTGIGPLALIAHKAGFEVSGSDKQPSQYTKYLQKHGINLHIGQAAELMNKVHLNKPIDWCVYSSALPFEDPDHPELRFAAAHKIKCTKRDECLNMILREKQLKLIAVAGTHGKTTTTAMIIWLFKKMNLPVSYSVGAKISFGDMGDFDTNSQYFIYECDEFDQNFLHFSPYHSVISTVDWDHYEIYPTRDDYKNAFRQFIKQSKHTTLFKRDASYLNIAHSKSVHVIADNDPLTQKIRLMGLHNRQNATIAIRAIQQMFEIDDNEAQSFIEEYPGASRRFEKIAPNLYSDYAHTPEEVAATIQLAKEITNKLVVVYEPLTDRRQHFAKDLYANVFDDIDMVYWLPSYLAREDKDSKILSPQVLLKGIANTNRRPAAKNDDLKSHIIRHLDEGATVLCLAGGGGGSLDEWLRANF